MYLEDNFAVSVENVRAASAKLSRVFGRQITVEDVGRFESSHHSDLEWRRPPRRAQSGAFGRRAPGLNSVRFDLSRYEPLYDQRSSPEDQDEDFAGGDDARGKF